MFCKDCGEKIHSWQEFCKHCGAALFSKGHTATSDKHTLLKRLFNKGNRYN